MRNKKYDIQRYAAALKFALDAHGSQLRKGSAIPYITHPVAVSALLAQFGYAEDLVIAGLLHDTIEDPKVPFAEIEGDFGRSVADLVAGVTEEKERDEEMIPWRERKEGQLAHFRTALPDVLALKAADTLHNVRSILLDLRIHGSRVWTRFNAPAEDQVWYYSSVSEAVTARLGRQGLPGELALAVEDLKDKSKVKKSKVESQARFGDDETARENRKIKDQNKGMPKD